MADITLVKISALPAAEQIGAEDLLPVVQEGATKAVAYGVIKDDMANELAPDATLSEAGKAADAKAVGDALALKADKTELTAEVNRIDAALNTKVNNTTYTAEVERIDDAIATKANAAETTAALATKANANAVTEALALKADKTEVNAGLALKADKTELTAGLAAKQNVLTFDTTPTEGSTNPVTSGGVWEAVQTDKTLAVEDKAADAKATGDALATKQAALTFDPTPTEGSTNPVTSGGVYSSIDEFTGMIFDSSGVAIPISTIPTVVKMSGTVTAINNSNPKGIKLTADSRYDTYYLVVTSDISISFASTTAAYLSLCVAQNQAGLSPGGTVLIGDNGVRYRKSESNLPTQQNPMTVEAGSVIAFSMTANTDDAVLGFASNYTVSQDFAEDVVEAVGLGKKPSITYTTAVDSGSTYGQEQLSVFLPAKSGYVKYIFVRCESNTKNANSWRIDKAFACDDQHVNRYALTKEGEWEMALRVENAPDFIGGIAHGDEFFTSFDVIVDGQHISDITTLQNMAFDECVIKETSLLYNPIDGATLDTRTQFTPIGTHGRVYIITADGIRLMQEVTFDSALTLVQSYMTMLPIIRGNDAVSADQITDHYFANDNYTTYDVSVGGSGEGYGWKPNVTMAHIWGNTSGVMGSVEMLKQPEINNDGARLFQVQSTVDAYNKLYWSVCGVSNHPYTTSAGERFVTDSMYKIDVAI